PHLGSPHPPAGPPAPTLFPSTTLFRSPSASKTLLPALGRTRRDARDARDRAGVGDLSRRCQWPDRDRRPGERRRQHLDADRDPRSEEHTSELPSRSDIVCRLLLAKENI